MYSSSIHNLPVTTRSTFQPRKGLNHRHPGDAQDFSVDDSTWQEKREIKGNKMKSSNRIKPHSKAARKASLLRILWVCSTIFLEPDNNYFRSECTPV